MTSTWLVQGSAAAKRREPSSYARGWEKRRETDERVEQNLDPREIAAWRRSKALFKGTPDERARKFREYQEERSSELRGEFASAGEATALRLVKTKREREVGVKVPCRKPYRRRVKAACNPELPRKRRPRWSLTVAGHRIEVPCDAPWRFSIKRDCRPAKGRKAWGELAPYAKAAPPKAPEDERGFFDDLLYG
jgi:hypothetical protein